MTQLQIQELRVRTAERLLDAHMKGKVFLTTEGIVKLMEIQQEGELEKEEALV